MKCILSICCILLFLACTNADNGSGANPINDSATGAHAGATDTIVHSTIALREGCYEMTMKRDTATLQISIKDSLITGSLHYKWYEKDHNTGTLKGILRDSIILADYTFESEGMTSVREVIFKVKGNTLLQGFGELKDEQGKIVFVNRENLQYTQSNPFIQVDCSPAINR